MSDHNFETMRWEQQRDEYYRKNGYPSTTSGSAPSNKLWSFWVYGNIGNTCRLINDRYPEMVDKVMYMEYRKDITVVAYRSPEQIHE